MNRRLTDILEKTPDRFRGIADRMTADDLHSLLTSIRADHGKQTRVLVGALQMVKEWAKLDEKNKAKKKGDPLSLVAEDVVRLVDKALEGVGDGR